MAQILQGPRNFGEILGSGLGEGFKQLANQKLQQVQQRNIAKGLSSIPGVNAEQAEALSHLEGPVLAQIVGDIQRSQREREFQQGYQPAIQKNQEMPQNKEKNISEQQLSNLPTEQQSLIQEAIKLGFPAPRNSKEAAELAKSAHEARLKKEKLSSEERREAFKETKAERNAILQKASAARNSLRDLDRIQDLEKEGKLDTPGYNEFLKRSGLDIPALMSEGSEEFNKITQNFLRDAKEYFGGRITNYEIEQFLKTVPNLSQSPEGRKRVIANLKYMRRAEIANADALKEVLKENNNIPPLDLLEQIEDKIGPKIEKLAEKFKEDISKPVPEAQNRLKTAAQVAAGSILGGGAKALGHAAPAIIGGLAGGPAGAAFGAGASGLYALLDYLNKNR